MSRSPSRILFASSHCLTDFSSGAAIATLDALRLLTRANFRCCGFCGSKFDSVSDKGIHELLADLRIPIQHQEMAVGNSVVRLVSLSVGDVPATIFPAQSTRIDSWSQGEPEMMLAAFERIVEDFQPDVFVTYGGDPVTKQMRCRVALGEWRARRWIPVVFWLHNFAYDDARFFEDVDCVIVPSEFSRQWYQQSLGLECRVLPYAIDPRRVREDSDTQQSGRLGPLAGFLLDRPFTSGLHRRLREVYACIVIYRWKLPMAACSRSQIVASGEVGVYHCWNRCVRRAFLCGSDPLTGKDYNYRRHWIQKQEQQLAKLFALEIAFHCEMSNHIHLVLRTRPDVARTWSDEEVVRRWLQIAHLKRGRCDEPRTASEARIQQELAREGRVEQLRRRLSSVSWFMGALCENIARRSNIEDQCTGRFWETRFRSRDLADESAILICGIYVDLNPIRAGEAIAPEQARYTSAYDRIQARSVRLAATESSVFASQAGESQDSNALDLPAATDPVMPPDGWLCELTLASGPDADVRLGAVSATPWRASDKGILSIGLDEYLKLLDWTGRKIVAGKRGAIPGDLAPILDRLHINGASWLDAVENFDGWFGHIVASAAGMARKAARVGRRWLHGGAAAAKAFT